MLLNGGPVAGDLDSNNVLALILYTKTTEGLSDLSVKMSLSEVRRDRGVLRTLLFGDIAKTISECTL